MMDKPLQRLQGCNEQKVQTAVAAPQVRIFFLFHDKSSQQEPAQTQQLQAGKAERSRLNPHILRSLGLDGKNGREKVTCSP